MRDLPTTSLIVVGYHRPSSLDELLRSIDRPVEVVVVVVECDPAVAAVAERHGANVILLSGNPGYAAAVGIGAGRATGDIVLFCNDDLRFEPGAIEALVSTSASTGAATVPSLVSGADGAVELSLMALVSPWSLLWEWALLPDIRPRWAPANLAVKWRHPVVIETVPAAMAAAVAIPRTVLLAHPLPTEYFLYWEEHEWFHVLAAGGIGLNYDPNARVVHIGGRSDVRGDKCALLARNAVRCVRRTSGPAMALLAWPVVVVWWTRLVVVDLVRWVIRPSRARRRRVWARLRGMGAALNAVREVKPLGARAAR